MAFVVSLFALLGESIPGLLDGSENKEMAARDDDEVPW